MNRDYWKRPIQSDRMHHEYGHNRLSREGVDWVALGRCLVGVFAMIGFLASLVGVAVILGG